jgi:uncharacterized protein YndB with AHSA1/START domain
MIADGSTVLRMTRRFDVPPERVFDAWIKAGIVPELLSPTSEAIRHVNVQARIGDSYLMTSKVDGRKLEAVGEYIEIDPPRLLVFTVAMPQFEPQVDRIAIEIIPDGEGCLLTLTHERLPPEPAGKQRF